MKEPDPKTCACDHQDAYECARIRDRRSGVLSEDEIDEQLLACECICHDDEEL